MEARWEKRVVMCMNVLHMVQDRGPLCYSLWPSGGCRCCPVDVVVYAFHPLLQLLTIFYLADLVDFFGNSYGAYEIHSL